MLSQAKTAAEIQAEQEAIMRTKYGGLKPKLPLVAKVSIDADLNARHAQVNVSLAGT
jgi:hypothetical protein